MHVPPDAAAAVDRHLEACDAAVPGLVTGLHVVGSIVLGDYRPERSDIDMVAVVAHAPDAEEQYRLAEVHRLDAPRVDGPYVPEAALGRAPEHIGPVAHHVDGKFVFGPCHEVSPVNWSVLARDAITVRGPSPRELGVRADDDAVRAFSAANLHEYWSGWASRTADLVEGMDDARMIGAWPVEWGVLGAARVHCAATTGRVVSKRGGGEYVLSDLPARWHPIARLAIDARDARITETRVAELRTACAFVHAVAG